MVNQIIDRKTVAIPGPIGDVTPALIDARDAAIAARNEAEGFASTVVAVQDSAVASLVADPASLTSGELAATEKASDIRRASVVSVMDFGARPDSGLDDTVAIQTAIDTGMEVVFPAGLFIAKNLVAKPGMILTGNGSMSTGQPSRLRTVDGNLFAAGSYGVSIRRMALESNGGDAIIVGGWSLSSFTECGFTQYGDSFPAVDVTEWVDVHTHDCMFDHTLTATVPTFRAITSTGDLAQFSFNGGRFTHTGNYAIWLEGQSGSVAVNFSISDVNFEIPNGGAIKLLSCRNGVLSNVGVWDFTAAGSKHMLHIGKSSVSGAVSENIVVQNYLRDASMPLASGIYDIWLGGVGECRGISMINVRHQLDGLAFGNFFDNECLVISSRTFAYDNAQFATIISDTVKLPAMATGYRDAVVNKKLGSTVFDMTLGKPIWYNGSGWVDASGSVV